MKWRNKGHEFDSLYVSIKEKNFFYLFGAGDYGRQFWRAFHDEFHILGYIDNDRNKTGKTINGIHCYAPEDIVLSEYDGIILTMSQIARTEPLLQMAKKGYIKNKHYFIIEEFVSVYYVYQYNKVYFSSISFLPSTVCNLKCRFCLNFNPFAQKFYVREWKSLTKDVDLFFSCVDYVMLFHVSGGEPLLYQYTADLIQYIDEKYGDRIGTLRMVTNGTIVPKEDVLKKLSQCNVEVTIDDYREAVPKYRENFEKLIEQMNEYGVRYYINKADTWIDLAPEKTDFSGWSDDKLEQHRTECNQSWQELRDGKLYNCNYAAYATVAGIAGEQDLEEAFDLTIFNENQKKELVEFRLGFTTKGYTEFCKKCRGFSEKNSEKVRPAIQMENNL